MPEVRAFRITRLQVWALRAPVAVPVATSFGVMRNRPAVFLRIEDGSGAFGWGEAFANWPAAGAEHRANLLIDDMADLVLGKSWDGPATMFRALEAATRIRALQCGEPGPFRQVTAALDIAAWDLVARRAGLPLARALSPDAALAVPAYASGIHVDAAASEIARARAAGFAAFKVKVGFDSPAEPGKLHDLASGLKAGERLFADANQAWDVATAEAFLQAAPKGLGWMEEPIPADSVDADWQRLASGPVPLAGGENIAGMAGFDRAIGLGALRFLQPDVAKWGGITGCLAVARQALAAGLTYCPHFLGGGIGLLASAHVLAAAGGEGLLEVDLNPNPLRDAICPLGAGTVTGGIWKLSQDPGLGVTDLPEELHRYVTLVRDIG
ncbi:mandelate racemase/muconate lactonizing enzyme family protein [Paracoccus siganidrum]|uniref:Mandelate racemase/muconate lactonizing enzyme family protein n=1 Tax=Paracoccus siganidrum TaxID=1276757 RepID=A0A419ACR4_9RHOB|nr:mandelate racemase/muconate lactonizing enzyme family protein [Paracoccus siganidrum]RJL22651.1 mandelate racemase/muconate lactonizing enzyme family protein [Paracoccus siganidrum]RMC39695.1 mandelate racemase/muconate lactonizing enzyme family protein [Paracoccus siganidrum]